MPEDEISLRELYLILKRGLPLIAIVSAVCAIGALVIMWLLPPVYSAEATTLVTPSPIEVGGTPNLSFRPSSAVSFEAYRTLAESRAVLEATRARLGIDEREFNGRLERLVGPQNPTQVVPLSVIHRVTHRDPQQAARIADAWAEATLEAVQLSLLASLEPVRATTLRELAEAERQLLEAEAAHQAFQEQDVRDLLNAQLEAIYTRINSLQARQLDIDREVARHNAQRQAALALEGGIEQSPEALSAALQLLQARQGDGELAELEALVRLGASGETDVIALLNRVTARDSAVIVAGLEAERNQLEGQLAALQQEVRALRRELAALNAQSAQLERALDNARDVYASVAALAPMIGYFTEVSATNTRVLNAAALPEAPSRPSAVLVAAVSLILGGLLATTFVLLREAVSTGEPPRPHLVLTAQRAPGD